MAELFFMYLRTSFMAGVMILAVLVARPLLHKAPRNIICLLWLLVALRLLIPFEVESPVSLQPRPISEPAYIIEVPQQWTPTEPEQNPPLDIFEEQGDDIRMETQYPTTSEQPRLYRDVEPGAVFAAIWMVGGVGLLIYAAVSLVVLRHRLRDAIRCLDGVWESDRISDAFLLGYWKPRIYLPVGLTPRDRELIVCHERAHQSRGDHWWKLLGLFCLSVHWFNPLVWLGFGLMCRDIETACDEKVISKLDLTQRKEYSLALLNSGKRLTGLLSYPVFFGEINLKRRIKSTLNYRKPGLWVTLGAVAVTTVIAVCFMTNPEKPEPEMAQTPPVADVQPETTMTLTEEATEQVTKPTEPTSPTTEVVTTPTELSTTPTKAATIPAQPTEPALTEPLPTEPNPTAPQSTEPVATEPKPTTPQFTEPIATEPKPATPQFTEPIATEPKPATPQPTRPAETKPQVSTVLAEGNWSNDISWKITPEGILIISGNRHIDGSSVQWYPWMDYKEQVTKIVINKGITNIPTHAFHGMNRVTEVSFPNTIEKIEDSAFWNCSSLQSVTIPPKVKKLEHETFFFCTSLRSVNFASGCSLETIGIGAFSETALVEFHAPASLKSIEENAFARCNSLRVLDLWECKASVHKKAFLECSGITQVLLGEGNALSPYGYPQWYRVETAKLYSDFYEIFSKRPQLQSVEIGGRVIKEIPSGSFQDCTALTNVTITAPITALRSRAFNNCPSLTVLKLPDTVTLIEASALASTGIKKFTVPSSVTKLSWGAFSGSVLEEITFLGDAPKYIDETAFRGVTATVYYPAGNPTWTQDKMQNYEGNLTWVPV